MAVLWTQFKGINLDRVRALLPPGWKPAGKPTVRRLYSLIVGGPTSRPGVRRFNLLPGYYLPWNEAQLHAFGKMLEFLVDTAKGILPITCVRGQQWQERFKQVLKQHVTSRLETNRFALQ